MFVTQRFYMVDVFAEAPYTGNPLPVIVCDEGLPRDRMQRITAEMNYSETAFVNPVPDDDGGYTVRLFTPAREIAFAGHPILGAACVIRDHVAGARRESVRLKLLSNAVDVTFEPSRGAVDLAWFRAPVIIAGTTVEPAAAAAAIGLSADEIDADSPVQLFGAGTAALLVPLRRREALDRCRLDLAAFAPLARAGFPPLVYVFCREVEDAANDFRVRFFFEAHGVREDAATGNGAAFLGAYLATHRLLESEATTLRIEQGHAVRRPSLVMLRVSQAAPTAEIDVGGRVVPIIEGRLL